MRLFGQFQPEVRLSLCRVTIITYSSDYLRFSRFDKTKQNIGVARTVGVIAPDTEVIAMTHRSILLVDDDGSFAESTKTCLLRGEGVANEVVIVRDGVEAVEYLFHPGRAAPEEMPVGAPGPQHASEGRLLGFAQDARRGAHECSSPW